MYSVFIFSTQIMSHFDSDCNQVFIGLLYVAIFFFYLFFLYWHFTFLIASMSSFGRLYRVTTYGESHCKGVGAIIDGVPPGMELTEADIQPQLTRRRPGQSKLTTPVRAKLVWILENRRES